VLNIPSREIIEENGKKKEDVAPRKDGKGVDLGKRLHGGKHKS